MVFCRLVALMVSLAMYSSANGMDVREVKPLIKMFWLRSRAPNLPAVNPHSVPISKHRAHAIVTGSMSRLQGSSPCLLHPFQSLTGSLLGQPALVAQI